MAHAQFLKVIEGLLTPDNAVRRQAEAAYNQFVASSAEKSSELLLQLIQQAPGARGTELHRKIGEPNKLIAIASWDSKADRDAMDARKDPRIAEIIKSAAPFVEIRPLGEFEDPEWVVLPPGQNSD